MKFHSHGVSITEAMSDVQAERTKQEQRGLTAEHDDKHVLGDLSMLGWEILYHLSNLSKIGCSSETREWIDKRAFDIVQDHDVRTALVKAAACIIADIERMDRAGIDDNAKSNQPQVTISDEI